MQKKYVYALFFIISSFLLSAQKPQKPTAVELYHQIQKLNFLGSVLYIAAHPDDENTRLISYMSNEQKARTGYLSLTRGDGGQNLIGTELRELLGVIRTQELIEARKIDGGEQFFTRANDFGYSKIPDETLQIWNKSQVEEDMIYIIRKFQPDVIINRFDHRTPGKTHGHHTSSAMLSLDIFDKTNDATVFPEQLQLVEKWQPQRLFFNTSWWFYGGRDQFEKADKSNLISFDTGVYYSSFGKSNQEIAALSRSSHQSQGFGSTGSRGEEVEYLEFIKGKPITDKSSLFDGIDTSWNRVKGGKPIGILLAEVEKNFDFKNPSKSIPKLVEAYQLIEALEDQHWITIKLDRIKEIIAGCAGLYLEAAAESQSVTPGNAINVSIEAINRSTIPIQLKGLGAMPANFSDVTPKELKFNVSHTESIKLQLPETAEYTSPYYLEKQGTVGMYRVDEQERIGLPDIIRNTRVGFLLEINAVTFMIERPVIYKYNDPVEGEVYRPFDIVPDVTTSLLDKVKIFNTDKPQTIGVKIKAGKDVIAGELSLDLPNTWSVEPKSISFSLERKGEEKTVYFQVTPSKTDEEVTVKCSAKVNGKSFDKEQIIISYPHISQQQVLFPSEAKFIKIAIKTNQEKIAYIMGAGDEVPNYLTQMGYAVSIVKPEEITKENLSKFDVVMVGIRAYNTVNELAFKQNILFDFVKNGKTMIVQYNTSGRFVTDEIAPLRLKVSRDRVTEEDAEVRFIAPKHPVLNVPNKITSKDFDGWVQERGLYFPDEWDKGFTPILSINDDGETAKEGALLVAPYGKGYYVYTGLSFFRELPAGVSGAYRLLSNIISLKNDANGKR